MAIDNVERWESKASGDPLRHCWVWVSEMVLKRERYQAFL